MDRIPVHPLPLGSDPLGLAYKLFVKLSEEDGQGNRARVDITVGADVIGRWKP